MAVSLAVFKTHCDLCPSEFNTTTALLRHREAKHHIDAHSVTILPFYNGQEVIRLPPRIRRGQRSSSYKQWISGIVDSINSCLHPKAAGKWSRVERYYVPEEYVQILLADMPNAFMNSGREKRHLRPPVWREKSNVFHYRDHDLNDTVTALGQQSAVPLKLKKTYLGKKEVEKRNKPQNAREALEAAKERARRGTANVSPTMKIQMVVGPGEGRLTREFEVIWWPELFSSTNHGKLTLRFYISKVQV